MAGVVSTCNKCGQQLWDEETVDRYCKHCHLPWGKYGYCNTCGGNKQECICQIDSGYCSICGNSKPECKCQLIKTILQLDNPNVDPAAYELIEFIKNNGLRKEAGKHIKDSKVNIDVESEL